MLGLWDFLRRPALRRTARQVTGRAGEQAAERFLRKAGYRIVARNVRYPQGEVDLVALDRAGGTLCFVEVRSRTVSDGDRPHVTPEESVTVAKRRRIIRAARRFAAERRPGDLVLRFDVVTVRFDGDDQREPDIRHYPGAFDGRGRLL
jgi:putative endonuclease